MDKIVNHLFAIQLQTPVLHHQPQLQDQLSQFYTKMEIAQLETDIAMDHYTVSQTNAKNGLQEVQLEHVLTQMIAHQETYVFHQAVQPKLELTLEQHALQTLDAQLKLLDHAIAQHQMQQLENVEEMPLTQQHSLIPELPHVQHYIMHTKTEQQSPQQMQQLH